MSEENKVYECWDLEIYENNGGRICINCDWEEKWITFDECAAEKMCKCIMRIAQQIRAKQEKEDTIND